MNMNIDWSALRYIDWVAVATIVAAVITSLNGGWQGFHHIVENWSPTARYRELRLLRSYESKVKEMGSTSSKITREAFASFINDDYCKITQMKFVRELKNYRKNPYLKAEAASPPEALLYEFSIVLILTEAFFLWIISNY